MASFFLGTNSVFTITTHFAELDLNVRSGEVTIDNKFFPAGVWGSGADGEVEDRGRYQAIGAVSAFLDTVASAIPLADFAPLVAYSAITMTFMTARSLTCNAHIHNVRVLGDRNSTEPVPISFNFRSSGTLTGCTI